MRTTFSFSLAAAAAIVAIACGTGGDAPAAPPTDDGGGEPAVDAGSTPEPDAGPVTPPPPPPVPGPVVISEIMYHPVAEKALEDNHEFIEIHNHDRAPKDVSGWRLASTGNEAVDYTFPAGTTIQPNGYVVVAKNKVALVAVAKYGLKIGDVLGDYAGNLDNGGTTLSLFDDKKKTIDEVSYKAAFPYPIAADAMGADDKWLERLTPPRSSVDHVYMGHSLERVSADLPSPEISNWAPSPLDGATPGRANASAATVPPGIVTALTVKGSGKEKLIRSADSVTISVTFSKLGKISKPELEYWVDDLQVTDEPRSVVPLTANGGAFEATLPPQPNNAIVRYRIRGDRGAGRETISPRRSDPLEWHAYFVTPPAILPGGATSTAQSYYLFIHQADWTQMWDNTYEPAGTDARRVTAGGNPAAPANRCLLRESWDQTVPAVMVFEGVVHDVFTRYQGSRWNRLNGVAFQPAKTTINPLPDRPSNVVLSWKVDFPSYARFEGKRGKITLHKLNSGCPGLAEAVGERIFGDPQIGIPTQIAFRWGRVNINGGYYHYMLDLERIDGDMMKRYRAPGERLGDLFKADGNGGSVEGPWGPANESVLPLSTACPNWTVDQRYEYTYERGTHRWAGPAMIRTMIEQLNALRTAALASGDWEPMRTWFKANWDYAKLRDYILLKSWSQTWDDSVHNHFMYRRSTDKRWVLIAVDRDREFGDQNAWTSKGTMASFYYGSSVGGGAGMNILKDAFTHAFKDEIWARIVELDATVLSPANFRAKVDEAFALFSNADYQASPAATSGCVATDEPKNMKIWVGCRHQDIEYLKIAPLGVAPLCNPANPSPY